MNNDMIRTYSYRISQATRSQLVVITYDIITDYLNEALNDDASSGYKEKLHMAMRGIDQLITGLDMEYEISVQLYQLYNYMKRTLISAQVSGERDSVSRVITMLGKLRTSFLEVSQLDDSKPLMKNTEKVYSGLTYSIYGANETAQDTLKSRGYKV